MRITGLVASLFVLFATGLAALAAESPTDAELAASIARGQSIYFASCSMCHGATGDGVK